MTTEGYELHVEKGSGNAAQTIANFTNKEDLKVLNEDIRYIKQMTSLFLGRAISSLALCYAGYSILCLELYSSCSLSFIVNK